MLFLEGAKMPLSCTIVVLFFSTLVSPIGSVDQKQMICMGKPVSQGAQRFTYNESIMTKRLIAPTNLSVKKAMFDYSGILNQVDGAPKINISLIRRNGFNASKDLSLSAENRIRSPEVNVLVLSPLYEAEVENVGELLLQFAVLDRAVTACENGRSRHLRYEFHLPWLYKTQDVLSNMRDAGMNYLSATRLKASALVTQWLPKMQDVLYNMRDAGMDHLSATRLKASALVTQWLPKMQDVLYNMRDAGMNYLSAARLKASALVTPWLHKMQDDLMGLIFAVHTKAAEYDYFWSYKIRDGLAVLFHLLVTMDKIAAAWNIAYVVISYKAFYFCVTFLGGMRDAFARRRHQDRSVKDKVNETAGNTKPNANIWRNNRRNKKKQQKKRNRNRR